MADQLIANDWQPIHTAPENIIVETKIDDEHGERNAQQLTRSGRLWFVPNGSTYVYYSPTHWRPVQTQKYSIAVEVAPSPSRTPAHSCSIQIGRRP